MSQDEFSDLLKALSQQGTRRAGLKAAALGAFTAAAGAVNAVGADAKNKDKKAHGKDKDKKGHGKDKAAGGKQGKAFSVQGVDAERCTHTGMRCGKGGNNTRPCKKCCSRYVTKSPNGAKRCTCRPDGMKCGNSSMCCSGVCQGGTCTILS